MVADGKDAIAALDLERHALVFEKAHDILIVKCCERAVQERAISLELANDFMHVGRIRDVAAPLARNHHLTARPLHLFEQRDLRAIFCHRNSGHHARRACPGDDYFIHKDFSKVCILVILQHPTTPSTASRSPSL